ncbi:MAG: HesA/MoeB/ThiF family protein [Acutalibacteraceae bacterium]
MSIKVETQGFDLKDFSVAVVGLGGLGCNVATHLAGSGIGKLYLCDYDKVNKSNLNRQFLYTNEDIGKLKTQKAKEKLRQYAPETEIITENRKITSESDLEFILGCDAVISCVDNGETRLIVEAFCKKNNLPLTEGGIDGFYGAAYLYIPEKTLPPSQTGIFTSGKAKTNISPVAGIIGSLQAALTIKYLLTKDANLSGKLLIYDEYKFDTLDLREVLK